MLTNWQCKQLWWQFKFHSFSLSSISCVGRFLYKPTIKKKQKLLVANTKWQSLSEEMVITSRCEFAACGFSAPKFIFLIFNTVMFDTPRKRKRNKFPCQNTPEWNKLLIALIYLGGVSAFILWSACCTTFVFSHDFLVGSPPIDFIFGGGSETAFESFTRIVSLWIREWFRLLGCLSFRVLVGFCFLLWSN